MLQKKSEYQVITDENSSFDSSTPQQHTDKKQSHLPLIQSLSQHEIPLLSTPHKRPMMTQSISHLPTFSSLKNHQNKRSFKLESSSHSLLCFSFVTNSSAHKLVQALCRFCLLRFHLRFLIPFSLPSLYFFFTNLNHFSVLHFLSIFAFFVTFVVISLYLALPRFRSLRLVLSRSLPIKFTSLNSSPLKEPLRPVLWSIGSKPNPAKNPISGSSVKVYSNGDVYEGEFHRGSCSGSGVYYYHKKGRYEGDWIDGKYDGYGVETWVRGSRYRGQYRQGLRHGIGVYRFYTGDVYAGEWSNGQCHGCGVHTCVDGSMYVGEFKWGVKHGLGHYHFRNGDTYSGEYFADRMHGFGVYQFGNGHRYEGAWHEGRRQGLGMYTFGSGETQCGHWQNGVLDVPSAQNTLPGSPYPVNHFKVLNAVQEAQQAAAKAYGIAKVEERVNKVVAAVNKAANAARVASVKAVQNQRHHSDCDETASPIDP